MRDFLRIVMLIPVMLLFNGTVSAFFLEKFGPDGEELDSYGPAVYDKITLLPDGNTSMEDSLVTNAFSLYDFDLKDIRDFCIYRFCEMSRENMSNPDLKAIVFLNPAECSLENFEIPGADDDSWDDDEEEDDDEEDNEDSDDEEENVLERLPFSYYPLYDGRKVKALLDTRKILLQAFSGFSLVHNSYSVYLQALIPVRGENTTYLRVKTRYVFAPQINYHIKGNGVHEGREILDLWSKGGSFLCAEGYAYWLLNYFHPALNTLYTYPVTQVTFTNSNRPRTIEDLFKPIPGEIIRTDIEFNVIPKEEE